MCKIFKKILASLHFFSGGYWKTSYSQTREKTKKDESTGYGK